MTANLRKLILYGLIISLTIILGAAASCRTPPAIPSPATGSSSIAGSASNQQRQGASRTPQVQPPTSIPTTSSAVDGTPRATTSPTTSPVASSTITTSIPILPSTAGFPSIGSSPIIIITAPLNVSTLAASDVTISDIVSNFNLVDKIGQSNIAGEGHIIYYMDVTPPTISYQAATTTEGTYAESTAASYTWHNTGTGFHYFSVQLVNNDSTPLIPAITVTVYVTISGTSGSNLSP